MLTTSELQAIVGRITYKPGWLIQVYDGDWEGQHVAITAKVYDSTRPGEMVTLDVHSMLPPQQSNDTFLRWIAWRLARIEVHEMREFLMLDGRPVFDPHAPMAERDNATYVPGA